MSGRRPGEPIPEGAAENPFLCEDPLTAAEDKRERLFRVIEETQARMHRHVPPDETMAVIRSRFPTPVCFLETSWHMLTESGLPRLDAFYYAMIPGLTRTVMREKYGRNPDLKTASRMAEYLKALFIGVHVECFYLIMLNQRGRLIEAVLLQKGTNDSAPFYLRPTLSTAISRNAKYIVLCHNHPGGTLRPSKEDLACTLKVLNAVAPMGLPMLDHIIIARDKAVSIRGSGLIPTQIWVAQAPGNRMLQDWLDVELLEED